MTSSPPSSVLNHPALTGLSEGARLAVDQQGQLLSFEPGQVLCDQSIIPSRVLLILTGDARLLHQQPGRINTIAKLGAGEWVGLASLLRAEACEEVTASTKLVAMGLPDRLVVDWLQKEPSFRQWCASTVLPAEVMATLDALLKQSPRTDLTLQAALALATGQVRSVPPDSSSLKSEADQGRVLLVASANTPSLVLADPLPAEAPLPKVRGPLPLRVLSFPAELLNQLQEPPLAATSQDEARGEASSSLSTTHSPGLPERSSLNLGNSAGDPIKGLKLVRGKGPLEGTVACFQMMARFMQLPFRRDAVERTLRDNLGRGRNPSLQLCGQLAANMGLHVVGMVIPSSHATRMQTPAMVAWGDSFALVLESSSAGLRLATPDKGWVQLTPSQAVDTFGEQLNLLLLDRSNTTPEQRFGFDWFWPALKRHRAVLIQVLVASFVVQLFTLANPLLIQVVIDKVISQRSLDTLQVLGFALVAVSLLEAVLGSLRTFLFAETTNRIDLRLGSEVIDHLLRLPLGYFDRRPVGELGTRIAELEKIRNFLTGQALTSILDSAFSLIYIVVMALYSWILTLVALAVLPIQIGLTVLGAPFFRRQYRKAAEENAKTQSHLVEVLTGIQTVKAQNVEMVSRWTWQDLYSKYIARSYEKTITGTALNETSQFLQKLSQLLVLWAGAGMVLQGSLTLGQLIAFRIISGYVTQPLLRLSNIWQSVQEL
ncbi:MAG: ABC transporter transmembrane domain-containing protein, partial [Synechococcaceae cyanobacterium]|nr:ABC transporter transmembrane domain-containing protein [Synechococcaceae cyanobacterium]